MLRFTTRELFWCMTLISCGIGCIAFTIRHEPRDHALFVTSGALIGAGIGALFQKWSDGATIGGIVVFLGLLLIGDQIFR